MRGSAVALLLAACGCGPGTQTIHLLPGAGTQRLQPIYDFSVAFPSTQIIISDLTYTGLDLDLEVTFDDASLRDDDPGFLAEARVVSVLAGGAPQAFDAPPTMAIQGSLDGGVLATGQFGMIRVGNAGLVLDLTGAVQDGGRRVTGSAALYRITDPGTFVAVKRRRYLVAGTDAQGPIGKAAVITVRYDDRFATEPDVEVISSDPVARVADARPFIVNRFTFDNVQGLDPLDSFTTLFERSTGSLSNPHDLVVVPAPAGGAGAGETLITRYGAAFNDVAVMNLADGAIVDHIDLTPYARNHDHLPRADQALLHDGLVYVTLEDADGSFAEFMNGRVVVIDPATRRVTDVIDLVGQNPFESLVYSDATGLIYVALAGLFPGVTRPAPVLSGGIETVDPATRTAGGVLVDDDALGGNVTAVAVESASRGYCVVSDTSFHNYVKAFDPSTGQVLETVFDSAGEIATIELDGDGYLLVADTSFFEPRVLIFNAGNGAPVAALPARLPPFSFAILTRSLP